MADIPAVARWQRRPRRASALALLGALLALGTLWALQSDAQPAFARVRAFEAALPQHDPALSAPEGRTGRYLRFSNQIQRLGWNNVFNEMLLNSELAHQAGMAYVFEEYAWAKNHYPRPQLSLWARAPWVQSPTTPLNALVAGPMVGGPWGPGDPAPRAVSVDYWEQVCPPADRHILYSDAAKGPVRTVPGDVLFAHMLNLVKSAPARCVEFVPTPGSNDVWPQTFDLFLVSTPRFLPLGQQLLNSSASTLLAASPLVRSAVVRNEPLFAPRGPRAPARAGPFAGAMAIHLRRGDYEKHCPHLARLGAQYYQWNMWPTWPDKFAVPRDAGGGDASDAAYELYRQHCYPTDAELLATIRRARTDYTAAVPGTPLDVLYVMTEAADGEWWAAFRAALAADGWATIVTTAELELDDEQTEVGMAVDMEIARLADVFVGNGWSSFTSNINHRRLVDGRPALGSRFW